MTQITDRIDKVLKTLNEKNIAKHAHTEFKAITPIRTGNARRNTNLRGSAIDADYPYAEALNMGGSKQAPKGMTEPTIDAIRTYIEKELNVKLN